MSELADGNSTSYRISRIAELYIASTELQS